MQRVNRMAVASIVVLSAAGALLSMLGDQWGIAILFVLEMVIGAAVLGRRGSRRAVLVRADLAGWLDEVAAASGETLETMVDRALADHRHRLHGDE